MYNSTVRLVNFVRFRKINGNFQLNLVLLRVILGYVKALIHSFRSYINCYDKEHIFFYEDGHENIYNEDNERVSDPMESVLTGVCETITSQNSYSSLTSQFENFKISKSQMNHRLRNNMLITIKKPTFDPKARNSKNILQTKCE